MTHEITCIVCPRGCRLTVDPAKDYAVSGNRCPRGIDYGRAELLQPVRTLTTTVALEDAALPRGPVRSRTDMPKGLLLPALEALKGVTLRAPVRRGDVVLADVGGSGVDIIVTRDLEALDG